MRILLAYDLSPEAEQAAGVVARAPWPPATTVRVVTSPSTVGTPGSSFAGPAEAQSRARHTRDAVAMDQDRIAAALRQGGLAVETAILPGQPGNAIVEEAERSGADLVVAGAATQGALAAFVLGSVSAQIVERSPCSVLVARTPALQRVLLAIDRSDAAAAAAAVVGAWPLFAETRIHVVGVIESPPAGGDASSEVQPGETGDATLDSGGLPVEACVARTVAGLGSRDETVTTDIRHGDPRTEVIAAARDWAADLVVVGVNGEPLLRRLLLGSVARTVLNGVGSSVLVVRPPRGSARPG